MKTKILIPCITVIFMLIGCTAEESTFQPLEIDIKTTINTNEPNKENVNSSRAETLSPCGQVIECDINYPFPTLLPNTQGYRVIHIEYDTSLTVTEVVCARQQYFLCFPNLRMTLIQSTDLHRDAWAFPLPEFPNILNNKVLDGSIDQDPRMCGNC